MKNKFTLQQSIEHLHNDFWRMWDCMRASRDAAEGDEGLGTYTFAMMAVLMRDMCCLENGKIKFIDALVQVDVDYSRKAFVVCRNSLELGLSHEYQPEIIGSSRASVWGPGTTERQGGERHLDVVEGDDGITRIIFQPDVFMRDMFDARALCHIEQKADT